MLLLRYINFLVVEFTAMSARPTACTMQLLDWRAHLAFIHSWGIFDFGIRIRIHSGDAPIV